MTRAKWTPERRAKFVAAFAKKREQKQSQTVVHAAHGSPNKHPDHIVYQGAVYKRLHRIKVVR